MKNYRSAFFLAVLVNVALILILGGAWWANKRSAANRAMGTTTPSAANQAVEEGPSPEAVHQNETPLATVKLSAERMQSIGVRFGTVERKQVRDEIRTTGTVAIDETRLAYVQTRISGHIEQVFANGTYQYVRRGQKLFTIHSPDLIAAEREYLLAKENAKRVSNSSIPGVAQGAASLLDSSRERLRQWSIPENEVARLESTGQPVEALEIDSTVSGYITERNALPNLAVQPETRLYTIADLSTVWVLVQVFQNELGRVKVGTPVALTVDSYPGRTFPGRVDFIYPDVDMSTRTARVRLVFPNPRLTLTPGMFINAALQVPLGNQLVVPANGVLHSGTRQIVFVDRGGGYLEPRDVQLGPQAGEEYIVLKGLREGERVVTSANFLIDSESQLQAAIGLFASPPAESGAAATTGAPSQAALQIEFSTQPSPPHKGTNLYKVKLASTDGAPVKGAKVSVRSYMPGMPQMGMAAMTLETQLTEKAEGTYEGQVNLPSGGTWQLVITATKSGATLATKQLSINAEGGM